MRACVTARQMPLLFRVFPSPSSSRVLVEFTSHIFNQFSVAVLRWGLPGLSIALDRETISGPPCRG